MYIFNSLTFRNKSHTPIAFISLGPIKFYRHQRIIFITASLCLKWINLYFRTRQPINRLHRDFSALSRVRFWETITRRNLRRRRLRRRQQVMRFHKNRETSYFTISDDISEPFTYNFALGYRSSRLRIDAPRSLNGSSLIRIATNCR